MLEEDMELHVSLPVEFSWTVRASVVDRETLPPLARPGMTGLVLEQLVTASKVPATVLADVDLTRVSGLDMLGQTISLLGLKLTSNNSALETNLDLSGMD